MYILDWDWYCLHMEWPLLLHDPCFSVTSMMKRTRQMINNTAIRTDAMIAVPDVIVTCPGTRPACLSSFLLASFSAGTKVVSSSCN